jgi:GH43 family beta-xylosidase
VQFSQIVRAQEKDEDTFTNPIVSHGADPWVIFHNGFYYYCYAGASKIWISKASRLQDIGKGKKVIVWKAPFGTEYSKEIWAPELHYLDGKWYVYFAADDGDNQNHRMYVLEGTSPDPQGEYVFKGKIADPSDKWAIDGTVLVLDFGEKYFIWSGWEGDVNVQQNLYIAPMSNPWTISGERVLISRPEYAWEQIGRPLINEGPQVLKHDTHTFIIYSASGSWTDAYCLGQLALVGENPLDPASWVKKAVPVFSPTDTVFGPGHASFTTSPDGTEDWIVYHAAKYKGAGWDRNVRIQPFGWTAEGEPDFGIPVDTGIELDDPSDLQ